MYIEVSKVQDKGNVTVYSDVCLRYRVREKLLYTRMCVRYSVGEMLMCTVMYV